jgi:uncharacterized protein
MRRLAFALSFIFLIGWGLGASAEAKFEIPPLTGPVVDTAGMLSAEGRAEISAYLHNLYSAGGTQIQVAIVPSLGGVSIEEAGIRLADAWKIGRQGQDTGVILLVASGERKVRIEVGKGREGDLPDLTASRIIREIIVPSMREGNPDRAIASGVMAIAQNTDPKLAGAVPSAVERQPRLSGAMINFLVFLLLFFILPLFWRGGGGGRGGGGSGLLWFLAGVGAGRGFGGGGGGSWGGGSSGGGWSGGGGGFSGGGASGGW